MALLKCPDCGKDVSDKAVACPNCGCPVDAIIEHGKRETEQALIDELADIEKQKREEEEAAAQESEVKAMFENIKEHQDSVAFQSASLAYDKLDKLDKKASKVSKIIIAVIIIAVLAFLLYTGLKNMSERNKFEKAYENYKQVMSVDMQDNILSMDKIIKSVTIAPTFDMKKKYDNGYDFTEKYDIEIIVEDSFDKKTFAEKYNTCKEIHSDIISSFRDEFKKSEYSEFLGDSYRKSKSRFLKTYNVDLYFRSLDYNIVFKTSSNTYKYYTNTGGFNISDKDYYGSRLDNMIAGRDENYVDPNKPKETPSPKPSTNTRNYSYSGLSDDDLAFAWVAAKIAVKEKLKAPSTAKFPTYLDARIGKDGKYYMIVGYCDAQNSFGAMIRTDFIVEIEKTGSETFNILSAVLL